MDLPSCEGRRGQGGWAMEPDGLDCRVQAVAVVLRKLSICIWPVVGGRWQPHTMSPNQDSSRWSRKNPACRDEGWESSPGFVGGGENGAGGGQAFSPSTTSSVLTVCPFVIGSQPGHHARFTFYPFLGCGEKTYWTQSSDCLYLWMGGDEIQKQMSRIEFAASSHPQFQPWTLGNKPAVPWPCSLKPPLRARLASDPSQAASLWDFLKIGKEQLSAAGKWAVLSSSLMNLHGQHVQASCWPTWEPSLVLSFFTWMFLTSSTESAETALLVILHWLFI